MTRLAVLSDIHGNLLALDAVIRDMEALAEPVDQVIVAGDSINIGLQSVEVLDRIAALGWAAIRGNHEFYLLDHGTEREPASRRDFTMPPWLSQTIPKHWKARLAAFPDTLSLHYPDAPPVRVAHGVPGDPWRGVYPASFQSDSEVAALLAGTLERTVILGHTHLPLKRRVISANSEWQIYNPGSVGFAIDGQPGTATYMLLAGSLAGWRADLRRVPFDLPTMLDALERIDYVAAVGPVGRLLIEELRTGELRVQPYSKWAHEQHPLTPMTLPFIAEFLALDPAQIRSYMLPQYQFEYERTERALI